MVMSWLWTLLIGSIDNNCNLRLETYSPISNQLVPCVTSCENLKKSAKISGRELWTSTGQVHPWVKFPDAWRFHINLFKQLYASVNTMGMSSHHITQEGDSFCVPEMKVFWCKMCIKPKTSPVPTWAERLLIKEEAITPKATSKSQITVCKCTGQRP